MAIQDQVTDLFNFNFSGIVGTITFFVILFLFVLIAIGTLVYVYMKKVYYKKIVIFERVGGHIQVTKKDVARNIRMGDAGDFILYTRKFKKFLPPASIQTGNNTYWYFIREDGEWINIGIKDIDEQMKEMNAHFLDKEMRFARTGMQKNLRERLQKITFWDKYGAMVIWTVYIVVVGIMTWLLFDKWIELSNSIKSAMETAKQVMDLQRETLQSIDNIRTGGGGIVPTG